MDPVLSQVYSFIIGGWPTVVVDPSFAPFKSKRDELTTQQGCTLWGTRCCSFYTSREGLAGIT